MQSYGFSGTLIPFILLKSTFTEPHSWNRNFFRSSDLTLVRDQKKELIVWKGNFEKKMGLTQGSSKNVIFFCSGPATKRGRGGG